MQNTVQIKTKNIDRTNDIIAGMLSNKTLSPIGTNLFKRKKIKHFFCFYHTNLFCCSEKYQT